MRSTRPSGAAGFSRLVLAGLVPTACIGTAGILSLFDPAWQSAVVLVLAGVAVLAAAVASIVIGRTLGRTIDGRADAPRRSDAEPTLAGIGAVVRELQTIGDALEAAGRRAPGGARLTAGIDMGALLADVVDKAGAQLRAAGLELALDLAPGLGAVGGNEAELEDALSSLIGNAVTFTPRGGTVALAAAPERGGAIRVTLEAGASGMAVRERAARPEARGVQLAGALIELTCGTSAAMILDGARRLVERNGGSLAVTRAAAGGASVSIYLPSARAIGRAA